ncbi:hypothetical protein TNCV_4710171 [Trichonephila clavipes]|nr:hypothetical protein TNCV_4710171 [Trichonephila clavipes]
MPSFLVLRERDNRNRWRDGQVCPDVGQGIMAPWARRLGGDAGKKTRDRSPAREGKEGKSPGSRKHERKALVGMDWKRALRKRSESGIGGERKERR